jgi:hypothetical protein
MKRSATITNLFLTLTLANLLNLFQIWNYFSGEDFIRFWDYRDHVVNTVSLSNELGNLNFSGFWERWASNSASGYPPTFLLPVVILGVFFPINFKFFALLLTLIYLSLAGYFGYKIGKLLKLDHRVTLLLVFLLVTSPISSNLIYQGFPDGALIALVTLSFYLCIKATRSLVFTDFISATLVLGAIPFLRKTHIYYSLTLIMALTLVFSVKFKHIRQELRLPTDKKTIKTMTSYFLFFIASLLLGAQMIPSFFGWDKESFNYVFGVSPMGLLNGYIEMNGLFLLGTIVFGLFVS